MKKTPQMGDKVRVIDSGRVYNTFDQWQFIDVLDNFTYGKKCSKGTEGVVIAMGEHTPGQVSDTTVVGIRTSKGDFMVDLKGVEVATFNLNSLKDTDIVETKNKERFIVMGDHIASLDGFTFLDSFDEDLTCPVNRAYDIVAVYRDVPPYDGISTVLKGGLIDDKHKIFSTGEKPKKMTKEEIEKLLGYSVEIASNGN